MTISRRGGAQRIEPVATPASLEDYAGMWVAVLDGKVIAARETSRELVYDLHKIGPKARGATMQRAPMRGVELRVGLG